MRLFRVTVGDIQQGDVHITPNAVKYLISSLLLGMPFGMTMILYPLYLLSLGFREDFIGIALSTSALVAAIGAIPAGMAVVRLGKRRALLLAGAIYLVAIWWQPFCVSQLTVMAAYCISGLAGACFMVIEGPFFSENAAPAFRTQLFSIGAAVRTVGGVLAGLLAGWAPGVLATLWHLGSAKGILPYRYTLLVGGAVALLAALPIYLMRESKEPGRRINDRRVSREAGYLEALRSAPVIWRLLLCSGLVGTGAGMLIPYLTIYLVRFRGASTEVVGTMSSVSSLVMVLGFALAPLVGGRMGKVKAVGFTTLVSVPFLLGIGYSPWLWGSIIAFLVRVVLMNMNTPLWNAFSMEVVPSRLRGSVSGMSNMTWQLSWAVSAMVSGLLIARNGYLPAFLFTASCYTLAGFGYLLLFRQRGVHPEPAGIAINQL